MTTPKYFERWFRAESRGIAPLAEDEVLARHQSGGCYVVVIEFGDEQRVLDFAKSWVTVNFVDALGRIYLKYDFRRVEEDKLFLSLASHFEYTGDESKPRSSTLFAFQVSGSTLIERRDLASGEVHEKSITASTEPNWEPFPAFGDYASLCRVDRNLGA